MRTLLCLLRLSLAAALRGPWAGKAWDPCFRPLTEITGFHRDLSVFSEQLLVRMRRAPMVGHDSFGVMPCVAPDNGLWLEFGAVQKSERGSKCEAQLLMGSLSHGPAWSGVFVGSTIRRLSLFRRTHKATRREPNPVVHGFDSFRYAAVLLGSSAAAAAVAAL